MKRIFFVASLVLAAGYSNAQTKKVAVKKPVATTTAKKTVGTAVPKLTFKSNIDSASYAFGQAIAADLKRGGITALNYELFSKGAKDAFLGSAAALDQAACQNAIGTIFQAASKKKEQTDKAKYANEIKAGEDFLAKNKTNPNVKTTASGLQYEILTQGTGAKPTTADKVKVHYKGTLIDGTQFDSSYDRGEPTSFGVTQVISGWTEGLQLMNEGSKFKFYIPYNLAYGSRDMGQIKPYSALVFEVELLKVNPED